GCSLVITLFACAAEPAQRDCDCASATREQPPEPEPTPAPEPDSQAVDGPRLRILGIAQDGGLPHTACDCPRCDGAPPAPRRASPGASVALVGTTPGQGWLVDATPDLPQQLDMLDDVRAREPGRVDRSPLAGVLLTHAHMGHYLGLAQLGYEAVS